MRAGPVARTRNGAVRYEESYTSGEGNIVKFRDRNVRREGWEQKGMNERKGHKERTAKDKHKEKTNRTREEKNKRERDKLAERTRKVGRRDDLLKRGRGRKR
jgi:hypothetical protein